MLINSYKRLFNSRQYRKGCRFLLHPAASIGNLLCSAVGLRKQKTFKILKKIYTYIFYC